MVIHADVWILLGFVVQFILPLLVGLVTTKVTAPDVQAILLAGLTVVVSVASNALSAHANGQPFDLVAAGLQALAGFVVSVGAHFGLWKPTGAASAVLGRLRHAVAEPAPAPVPPTPAPAPAPAPAPPVVSGTYTNDDVRRIAGHVAEILKSGGPTIR
jgi:hypothetical protein